MSRGAIPAAYAESDCIKRPCTNCGANPGEYCRLSVDGKTYSRHVPCLGRLRAAGKGQAS